MSEQQHFIRIVLGLICSIFEAYSCVLFLKDKKNNYKLASYFSLGDHINRQSTLEPGQGLVGWIIKNNQPLLINQFDRQGNWLGYYNHEAEIQIKTFMGCPLDKGQGALCLDSKKTYSFSTKDQKILHQFVQVLETWLDSKQHQKRNEQGYNYYNCLQLIRKIQKKNPRWSNFLDKFLRTVSLYTNFSYCLLATRDERGEGFFLEGWNKPIFHKLENHKQKFSINSSLIGWVFKNHTYVSTAEKESKAATIPIFEKKHKAPYFQSVVCLPLIVYMRTRGVLILADKEHQPINEELKAFLEMITDQLAIFLENLYLKNKLKHHSG